MQQPDDALVGAADRLHERGVDPRVQERVCSRMSIAFCTASAIVPASGFITSGRRVSRRPWTSIASTTWVLIRSATGSITAGSVLTAPTSSVNRFVLSATWWVHTRTGRRQARDAGQHEDDADRIALGCPAFRWPVTAAASVVIASPRSIPGCAPNHTSRGRTSRRSTSAAGPAAIEWVVGPGWSDDTGAGPRELRNVTDERLADQAAEAFIYGFPLVFDLEQVDRLVTVGLGATPATPFNQFGHARALAGPADTFVSVNNDTLYSIAQIDLGVGLIASTSDTAIATASPVAR